MKNKILRSARIKNINIGSTTDSFLGTLSFKLTTTTPPSCNCFQVYKPVKCRDGKIYSNSCFALCYGQTDCTEL